VVIWDQNNRESNSARADELRRLLCASFLPQNISKYYRYEENGLLQKNGRKMNISTLFLPLFINNICLGIEETLR